MNSFGESRSVDAAQTAASSGRKTATTEVFRTVSQSDWLEFIGWIDPLKDDDQVGLALCEFERRRQLFGHSPAPLEAMLGDQRIAGAYMVLLGARVAALAGVRGIDNHDSTAARLLTMLVEQVRAAGVVQIQAILDGSESIAEEIVELAGFMMLAELQQMALMLPKNPGSAYIELAQLPVGLQWVDARTVSHSKLTQLIAHTFIETLDCPALNGLRGPEDVLEGFLDGQELQAQEHWWILANGEKLLGCSFVNSLPNRIAELVYMGLGVTSRGRGYGKLLLEQGIRSALKLQAESFLAAVDCDNWPAIRLYGQAGFQEHGRVQAWIHRGNA